MRRAVRTLLAGAAIGLVLPLAASIAPAQAAASVRVTGPAYDSPGSTVAVVVTTSSRPSGYTLTFRVSVAGITGVCNGSQWRHSTGWSQRCWVTLPSRTGTWSIAGRAVFTRTGYTTQYLLLRLQVHRDEGLLLRPRERCDPGEHREVLEHDVTGAADLR